MNAIAATVQAIDQRLAHRGGGGGGPGGPTTTESLGAQFCRSPQFESFRTGGLRAGMTFGQNFEARSVTALALGPTQRLGEVASTPKRRPALRSLIPQAPTTASAIDFVRQTAFVDNAAPVSETTQKPESTFDFEVATARVATLAHFTMAPRQAIADVSGLEQAIDNDLILGLLLLEEGQLLLGDGTGINLLGIIPQATAYAPVAGTSNSLDVIAAAARQLIDSGTEPTGLILNSGDWLAFQLSKNSVGDYYAAGSGSPFGVSPSLLWGLNVVATPVLPADSFLLGDFTTGCQIFQRDEISVAVSTEDRDNFIKNMATILVEERLAFVTKKPGAFVTGSITDGVTSGA
jgi:HK97 family phage major capsid protein